MRYSLSSRQQSDYLLKCDEIKVMWNDRNIIFDLIEKYPDKQINLCRYYVHSNEDDIDWREMITFQKLAKGGFHLGLSYVDEMKEAQAVGVNFYYLEPVRSFREAQGLKAMGVSYMIVDAPLFFQMDKIKAIGIPMRATANLSIRELLDYEDGVPGPWIRPEDAEMYDEYIDMLEFGRVNLDQERALFRIYAEQKKWSGDLGLIIQDLNHMGVNRMIPSSLTEQRMNCGQRCQENGHCHACWRVLDLANPDLIRDYQSSKQ